MKNTKFVEYAREQIKALEDEYVNLHERFGYVEDEDLEEINFYIAYWESVLENPEKFAPAEYVETYNCLLDSVFVPDMTDRMQEKTMQQRLRDEEPDVFDSVVSQAQMDEWIYG